MGVPAKVRQAELMSRIAAEAELQGATREHVAIRTRRVERKVSPGEHLGNWQFANANGRDHGTCECSDLTPPRSHERARSAANLTARHTATTEHRSAANPTAATRPGPSTAPPLTRPPPHGHDRAPVSR